MSSGILLKTQPATIATTIPRRLRPQSQTVRSISPASEREIREAVQLCVYGLLPDGPAPLPPSSLHVSDGDGQVSLSWAASKDATTYAVKRSLKNACLFETIASGLTSTTFTDVTAGNGMTYQYTVDSVNSNGESGASSVATIFLPKSRAQ